MVFLTSHFQNEHFDPKPPFRFVGKRADDFLSWSKISGQKYFPFITEIQ